LRLAILSDTHIPTRLADIPAKVYEVCGDADLVLHAGDHVRPDVIADLERVAAVKAVQGNMDGPDLAHLPERLSMDLEGFRVCMAHGSGAPFRLEKRVLSWFDDCDPDIVVFGHTHTYMEKTAGDTLILNPGAVSARPGRRTMMELTLEEGRRPEVSRIGF
jgi:hypothetical protein